MSKKKKQKQKKPKTRKKPPSKATPPTFHYYVHDLDLSAWGSRTLCGKPAKRGTYDITKVTCKRCKRFTNWNVAQYKAACAKPLNLVESL